MDRASFTAQSPGQLIRISEEVDAFVPKPLPPEILYNQGVVGALSRADTAVGQLSGLGRNLPNPHLLINPLVRREAVLSSRIEGTISDLDDLYVYESEQSSGRRRTGAKSDADVKEVMNYVEALNYGLKAMHHIPVSLRLIRDIHRILLTGVRGRHKNPGEFRTGQNCIGAPGDTLEQATYVPPPPNHMGPALDQFEKFIHGGDDIPHLIKLALIHYQFEAIHPFGDGNGRIGRLLIPLLLISWDRLGTPLLYMSAFFERNRDEYNDRLLQVSLKGAWREWITFFLEGVAEQSIDTVERVDQLLRLRDTWVQQLTANRAPSAALGLVDRLFEYPHLTINMAWASLAFSNNLVSYSTAKRAIERLEKEGILVRFGTGRYRKTYVAKDIINIISR